MVLGATTLEVRRVDAVLLDGARDEQVVGRTRRAVLPVVAVDAALVEGVAVELEDVFIVNGNDRHGAGHQQRSDERELGDGQDGAKQSLAPPAGSLGPIALWRPGRRC